MPDHHLSEDSVTRSAEAFLRVGDFSLMWFSGWRSQGESGPGTLAPEIGDRTTPRWMQSMGQLRFLGPGEAPHMQRYVSTELTHFVGRGKARDEQYRLLVTILRSGELRSDPSRRPGSPGVSWTTLNASFSEREMYHFPGVCFCDIPAADLSLHIGKYSPFGIAFAKPFLVKRGASPVFYVAKDSEINLGGNAEAGMRQSSPTPYTRAVLFNEMTASFHKSAHTLLTLASTVTESDGPKAREPLRANIDETLTAAIITEQGGKEKHRERSQEFIAFCSQFWGR